MGERAPAWLHASGHSALLVRADSTTLRIEPEPARRLPAHDIAYADHYGHK